MKQHFTTLLTCIYALAVFACSLSFRCLASNAPIPSIEKDSTYYLFLGDSIVYPFYQNEPHHYPIILEDTNHNDKDWYRQLALSNHCENLYHILTGDTITDNDFANSRSSDSSHFQQFLKQFCSDSLFQIQHIQFPLIYVNYYDKLEELGCINQNQWQIINFWDNSYNFILTIKFWKDSNIMSLRIQIDDTGVDLDYIFASKDNTWHLVTIFATGD